ncbi:glycosyltransferase [Cytophagaceae bacterium ABcell3]|nr:glycosyltransferase [Cytophagaceae bacterium ABcell3]
MKPLVTVVCLSYNHQGFLAEALDSVLGQTYSNIEVIVVDDASTDDSREVIAHYVKQNPSIKLIPNGQNLGNCRSFNKALDIASGEYIIDFATDDVMHPERVEKQVAAFERLSDDYAAVFTNAAYIDEHAGFLKYHYRAEQYPSVPCGDIYKSILSNNGIICTPTLMFRTHVVRALGGYDERLSYEDFDICLRVARKYKFYFLKQVLTEWRIVAGSHSKTALHAKNISTFRVCMKAFWLNKTPKEHKALAKFIKYNLRYCVFINDHMYALKYWSLLKCLDRSVFWYAPLFVIAKLKINIFPLYRLYVKLKYGYEISR